MHKRLDKIAQMFFKLHAVYKYLYLNVAKIWKIIFLIACHTLYKNLYLEVAKEKEAKNVF